MNWLYRKLTINGNFFYIIYTALGPPLNPLRCEIVCIYHKDDGLAFYVFQYYLSHTDTLEEWKCKALCNEVLSWTPLLVGSVRILWSNVSSTTRSATRRLNIIWKINGTCDMNMNVHKLQILVWFDLHPELIHCLCACTRLSYCLKHLIFLPLQKLAYSNVWKISPPKNWNYSDKELWYFSYFCSKHRLWVIVRTALVRRF